MRILAELLALVTRRKRYFPEIEWSDNSWTHNVFRFYESIFGRRVGIRTELTSTLEVTTEYRRVTYQCHSWESVFALTEQHVREYLSSWKWKPLKIYIPVLQTTTGHRFFASPYIFAIAHDVSDNTGGISNTTPWTVNHTCTGSNMVITANLRWWSNAGTQTISSVTYNSLALTEILTVNNESPTNYKSSGFYRVNPTTGSSLATTVTFSAASYGIMGATSFSGSNTTAVVGASTSNNVISPAATVTATNASDALATTFANSMVVDILGTSGGITTITPGQTTNFAVGASPACAASQRRLATTTGSYGMDMTWSGADQYGHVMYELKALVASSSSLTLLGAG